VSGLFPLLLRRPLPLPSQTPASLACAAPALSLSRTLRLGLGLLGVMDVEGAEQRWGSRVRVSDMGVFGLSPAAPSTAMASPVPGLSGLTRSLSLSLSAKLGFRGFGVQGVERDEGQSKGVGYEGQRK